MNKIFTLLLSSFFFLGTYIISFGQTWEVYNTKMELKSRVVYDEIEILSETVRIGKVKGDLFLLSQDLKPSLQLDAKEVHQFLSPWLIVKGENGLGAYHEYGQKQLENEYDEIQTYFNILLAKKGNEYFVFERGNQKTTSLGELDNAFLTKYGLVITENNGMFYLPLSESGDSPFLLLSENEGDYLLAKGETGYGIINRSGDYVLEPVLDELEHTEGNFFYGYDENQYLLIKGGELRAEVEYNSFHKITREENLMLEYIHGKLRRVMNMDGILLDTVGMESVEPVGESFFNVKLRGGKTGLLGKDGWEVLPNLDLEKIFPGNENLYSAIFEGKYGVVDPSGNWVIEPTFEEISVFNEGIAVFKEGNQFGLLDASGKILQSPSWKKIMPFQNGTTILTSDDKKFLIDTNGSILTIVGFDELFRLEEGGFLVENEGEIGLINKAGEELIPSQFELIQKENEDYVLVKKDGLSGIVNQNGGMVLPIAYEQILFDWDNQQILVKNTYLPVVVQDSEKDKSRKKGS